MKGIFIYGLLDMGQTTNKYDVNAWKNDKGEYRYNIEAANGKVIQGAHQGFDSRQGMEHNMKLNGRSPDKLPDRITKKD